MATTEKQKRVIKDQYPAERDDIADLKTRRALPTHHVQHIDPFLFLNHHGPQVYPPKNRGLPFGPHPHRGFETVTFILKGDIAHRDSGGGESVIREGGVQWMTAGRGLVHSEVSSGEFLKNGGDLEVLQLWVNLPARLKMTEPGYIGLQKDQVPSISLDGGKVSLNLISGAWENQRGAIQPLTDIRLMTLEMKTGGKIEIPVAPERNVFFYVVRGSLTVNGQAVEEARLVKFENRGNLIEVTANREAYILFGDAVPFSEPIVAHGPFVMNTREQIIEAIQDYQAGKFG